MYCIISLYSLCIINRCSYLITSNSVDKDFNGIHQLQLVILQILTREVTTHYSNVIIIVQQMEYVHQMEPSSSSAAVITTSLYCHHLSVDQRTLCPLTGLVELVLMPPQPYYQRETKLLTELYTDYCYTIMKTLYYIADIGKFSYLHYMRGKFVASGHKHIEYFVDLRVKTLAIGHLSADAFSHQHFLLYDI